MVTCIIAPHQFNNQILQFRDLHSIFVHVQAKEYKNGTLTLSIKRHFLIKKSAVYMTEFDLKAVSSIIHSGIYSNHIIMVDQDFHDY